MWNTVRVFRKIHTGIVNLNETIDLNKVTNNKWNDFKCIYSIYSLELPSPNGFVDFKIEKTNTTFRITTKSGFCNKATFKFICMEDF